MDGDEFEEVLRVAPSDPDTYRRHKPLYGGGNLGRLSVRPRSSSSILRQGSLVDRMAPAH